MVDDAVFSPVVNHYRWFVETLARIASIYLFYVTCVSHLDIIAYLARSVKSFCDFFVQKGDKGKSSPPQGRGGEIIQRFRKPWILYVSIRRLCLKGERLQTRPMLYRQIPRPSHSRPYQEEW